MKKIVFIWGAFLIFVTIACDGRHKGNLLPELVQAESLMYTHPDSALQILERIPALSLDDDLNHATWCLLVTQARDKNDKKHTSDSLINIAYSYFKKRDDPQRKALAANYEGRINEDLGYTEEALQYYLEAASEVEKSNDYRLGYFVFSNLGHIYLYRSLFEYAMPAFQKSHYYATLSKNADNVSFSLSFIARAYSIQSNWDESIEYYKKAVIAAEAANNMHSLAIACGELANIYNQKGDYALALIQARKLLVVNEKRHLSADQSLLIIGDVYRNIGNADSAFYYFNKAKLSENIYTVHATYHALYHLSKVKGRYKEALEYNDKILLYTDSIQKIELRKEMIEMQEKYNKEKLLNEKNQLQMEKDKTVRIGLCILLSLLFIIAVLIYIYQRKLIRKERTIQKNEEQIRQYLRRIHDNESLINLNKSRMLELNYQIEKNQGMQEQLDEQQKAISEIQRQNEILSKENMNLQTGISRYSQSLQEKAKELDTVKILSEENLRLRDRENFLCSQLLKKTEVLTVLKQSPKYQDAVGMYKMQEAVDGLYDRFSVRLGKQYPELTESDLHICCLIKLRLSNPEIAILLGISPSSVSKRKQRIKERISQALGGSWKDQYTLDLWLWEY